MKIPNEWLNAVRSLIDWAKKADQTIHEEWRGRMESYVQAEEITKVERLLRLQEEHDLLSS